MRLLSCPELCCNGALLQHFFWVGRGRHLAQLHPASRRMTCACSQGPHTPCIAPVCIRETHAKCGSLITPAGGALRHAEEANPCALASIAILQTCGLPSTCLCGVGGWGLVGAS